MLNCGYSEHSDLQYHCITDLFLEKRCETQRLCASEPREEIEGDHDVGA